MTTNISSKQLDSIIEVIESNNELIQYDYQGKKNQILIPRVIVDKINRLLLNIGFNKHELKESVKLSIKRGFELSSSDIVISKNGEFFIKLFEKTKKHEVEEKDKNTIVNRYNGIDKEELELFYDEFFAESENKNFFVSVAIEFVDTYLNEKKITNDIYEKNVFSYIHTITFENLVTMYDDSDGFFTGFAGYIFRIHFNDVFEHIADLLLDEISMSNSHMIEFLKYYSQDIIVAGGKKYKVPSMETKDGLRWNVGSILSISRMYTKNKKMIKTLQKNIADMNTEIKKLYIGNLTPFEYQTSQIQKRQSFDEDITKHNKKIEKYLDNLNISDNQSEKQALKKEIHLTKEDINRLKEEKNNLIEDNVNQGNARQYSKLQKELDSLNRQLKREKLIITQNKDSYNSIRESLIKALISKKQLL